MRRFWIVAVLAGLAMLGQGCSSVEPRSGTKVTLAFTGARPVSRENLAAVSRYLMARGRYVLGVEAPRVDAVSDDSLVLLLPGRKIPRAEVAKLTERTSIELYRLSSVATRMSPNRPWKLRTPATPKGPYLLLGPDAKRIDSQKEPKAILKEVVGYPNTKPVLTGSDIQQNATCRPLANGYGVLIHFTKKGAKVFYDFTKSNRGEYLAVFYNGTLLSAPTVEAAISGGEAYITGFADQDQACGAAAGLNAGDLPAKVKIAKVEYYGGSSAR